ncbi:MAG: zinc ribbon domain-containing protein [Lachnospiraceae bacterium]|nr:zinc ribbon domain-containing protein [Lachnospiraceae bacterium]
MEGNFDGMEFVNKIGETISAKGKEVTDKAKDVAEIVRLKSQIKSCEDIVKRNYMEIGRRYYELHASTPEEHYAEQCIAINNAQDNIAEYEQKIKEIKGV